LAGTLKIICFDCTSQTREMLKKGVILVSICQEPEIQGYLPLNLLFNYLALGTKPEKEYFYTKIEIAIKESI
ncbi:MAG: LacI family transcriptional regulator, partial [Oscillospiraceae bacterium]